MQKVLITGSAGFIGFHLAQRLLQDGHEVVGLDGLTDYYDVSLKRGRLSLLNRHPGLLAVEGMLEDSALVAALVRRHRPELVIHLAAQAGVRESLNRPVDYLRSNVLGTQHLLDALTEHPPAHLMFASSSSVYGGNRTHPFAETDRVAFPVSPYGATKIAGESLTHSFSHLTQVPTTCLRFFTVYGPWGRPDMALFKFADRILRNEPLEIYGDGSAIRDFTFVADLVEAVGRLAQNPPAAQTSAGPGATSGLDSLSPVAPWRAVNIGGGTQIRLTDMVSHLETALGRPAIREHYPQQAGDVIDSVADSRLLESLTGYRPHTPFADGVKRFADWYLEYFEHQAAG